MPRSQTPEILDCHELPEGTVAVFHRDLARIHRLMGNVTAVIERLTRGPEIPRSVIDIGCGHGALLAQIRDATGARVTGVDLKPPASNPHGVEILAGDATRDPLPRADAAVSFLTIHHLTEEETIASIRNVGRFCGRFIIMDLVRHPLPLALFTVFLGPLIHRVARLDGQQSIRRSYTGPEMAAVVNRALEGTGAKVEHWVSPFRARQIVDITYRPDEAGAAGRLSRGDA